MFPHGIYFYTAWFLLKEPRCNNTVAAAVFMIIRNCQSVGISPEMIFPGGVIVGAAVAKVTA